MRTLKGALRRRDVCCDRRMMKARSSCGSQKRTSTITCQVHQSYNDRQNNSRTLLNTFSFFKVKNSPHARHYKIKQGDYLKNFFLVQHTTFKTLPELIEFYCKSQNGLCVKLDQPCVKVGISIRSTA